MCGLAGYITRKDRDFAPDILENLQQAIVHRGPDAQCIETFDSNSWHGGLIHNRLSIIDVSDAAKQPMHSACGRYSIVYNGEIYNYKELRASLIQQGYQFKTESDTEVLLYAWHFEQERCLTNLKGMYAFAIIDNLENSLTLTRDAFGIKPLYWFSGNDTIAFASEIPAMLTLPEFKNPVINPQKLYDYLRYSVNAHGPEALVSGIHICEASTTIKFDLNQLSKPPLIQRVDLIPQAAAYKGNFKDATEELRELLLASVRLHLRSDVPLGFALSGGIDSTAIISMVKRLEPDAEIHGFSFISDDEETSDNKWINIASDHVGAIRHDIHIKPEEVINDLDDYIRAQGTPFISTSIYAQYRVFKKAKEAGIKVVLEGQGADEMFAGYLSYNGARLASLVHDGRLLSATKFAMNSTRSRQASWVRMFPYAGEYLLPQNLGNCLKNALGKSDIPTWFNRQYFNENNIIAGHPSGKINHPYLQNKLEKDRDYSLLPALLKYGDRNAMASSVENRVPFLLPEIAGFARSLPEDFLISPDGTSKYILREAMKDIIPQEIYARKDKIGFVTPQYKWLKENKTLVKDILNQPLYPCFDTNVLDSTIKNFFDNDGDRSFAPVLWRILNLQRWMQLFNINE